MLQPCSTEVSPRGWRACAIGGDWQAMETLKLSASYLYVENKGNATFGYQSPIVLNNPPVLPINNFDSSKQQCHCARRFFAREQHIG